MIQIDMPMPRNCLDCPACNEYLMCAIPVNGRTWGENDVREFGQGRPEWCPMKEQEKQKFFVDENGKITPLPVVARCKDCKNVCMCDTSEILPGIPIYAKCTLTDKVHKPDWFCADGERKEGR